MTQSIFVNGIERPAGIGVDDERGKGGRSGNRASRCADGMRVGATGVARRAPMPMVSAGVARIMRRMARTRVMAMAPVMVRLGGRAGEEEDRG